MEGTFVKHLDSFLKEVAQLKEPTEKDLRALYGRERIIKFAKDLGEYKEDLDNILNRSIYQPIPTIPGVSTPTPIIIQDKEHKSLIELLHIENACIPFRFTRAEYDSSIIFSGEHKKIFDEWIDMLAGEKRAAEVEIEVLGSHERDQTDYFREHKWDLREHIAFWEKIKELSIQQTEKLKQGKENPEIFTEASPYIFLRLSGEGEIFMHYDHEKTQFIFDFFDGVYVDYKNLVIRSCEKAKDFIEQVLQGPRQYYDFKNRNIPMKIMFFDLTSEENYKPIKLGEVSETLEKNGIDPKKWNGYKFPTFGQYTDYDSGINQHDTKWPEEGEEGESYEEFVGHKFVQNLKDHFRIPEEVSVS